MKVYKISPLGITLFEENRHDRTNSHSSDLFVIVTKNCERWCAEDFLKELLGNRLFAKLRHRLWDNTERYGVC
jgi:hypothetical protein